MRDKAVEEKQAALAESRSDRVFSIVNNVILILFIIAYPLYYILVASFSDPYQVYAGNTFWKPAGFTVEGYTRIFQDNSIVTGYLNSILYTFAGTIITVFLIVTSGYALSKKDLPGRKPIMLLFVFTMYFSGGLIPTYMVVQKLNLMNSMWALVLPASISVFNMIVARTFFETSIPDSLTEAAYIDGCSNMRAFLSIVLPLAKPIIAVMVVFNMVNFWNDWFNAMIYLPDSVKHPLQLVLRKILIQSQAAANMMDGMSSYADKNKITEMIKFSSIVVASVPMLVIYPFVQRHFNKGVMIGAVKG